MKLRNQEIIFSGMFIALSVVLTRFASLRIPIGGVEGIRIGFGMLPTVLAGILFGPWIGGIVGALADLIGFSLSPMGPYFPHFTLTSALHGFIPGIFGYWFSWGNLEKRAIVGIFATQVLVSGLLTPYFLHTIFGMPWQVLLVPRLFTIPLHIAVYSLLALSLIRFSLRTLIPKKS
ncbi:MAG: folate family ECF transporter S component [Candidatus Caldatribacteriaceae bacterium]